MKKSIKYSLIGALIPSIIFIVFSIYTIYNAKNSAEPGIAYVFLFMFPGPLIFFSLALVGVLIGYMIGYKKDDKIKIKSSKTEFYTKYLKTAVAISILNAVFSVYLLVDNLLVQYVSNDSIVLIINVWLFTLLNLLLAVWYFINFILFFKYLIDRSKLKIVLPLINGLLIPMFLYLDVFLNIGKKIQSIIIFIFSILSFILAKNFIKNKIQTYGHHNNFKETP